MLNFTNHNWPPVPPDGGLGCLKLHPDAACAAVMYCSTTLAIAPLYMLLPKDSTAACIDGGVICGAWALLVTLISPKHLFPECS